MHKKSLFCIAILLCTLLAPCGNRALAHATPIAYEPESSSLVEKIPPRVRIHFSERIEAGASGISVVDPSGIRTNISGALTDPHDARIYETSLKDTGPGTYSVMWQVVSADDGHFTKGAFAFSVGKESATVSGAPGQIQIQHITSIPQAMALFCELLGQSLLVGMLLVFVGIWKPLLKRSRKKIPHEATACVRRRTLSLILTGWFLILIGVGSHLVLKTLDLEQLRGTDFITTFKVFARTLDGTHALVRVALGSVFAGFFFAARKKLFAPLEVSAISPHRGNSTPLVSRPVLLTGFAEKISVRQGILFLLLSLMALSRARVSHSAAGSFPSLSVGISALHLLAKEFWIGGLLVMTTVFMPALRKMNAAASALFSLSHTAFSKLASIAFGLVGVTGAYIVWLDLKSPEYLFATEWGARFIVLSLLGGILFAVRLYHQVAVERSTLTDTTITKAPRRMLSWAPATLILEAGIGVALLFATSILIITTPPYPGERFLFEKQGQSQGADITLQVDPYEPSQFLVTMLKKSPSLASPAPTDISIKLTNEEQGIGPLVIPASLRFPGGFVFPQKDLPISGTWRINLIGRYPNALDATASFTFRYPDDIAKTRIDPEHRSFGAFELFLLLLGFSAGTLSIMLYRESKRLNDATLHPYDGDHIRTSTLSSLAVAFCGLLFVAVFLWISYTQFIKTDFQKRCERDGNFWLQSVPMRDGAALSSDTVTGCTLNIGLYHFVDEREYAFFLRPRQSGVSISTVPQKPTAGKPTDLSVLIEKIEGGQRAGPVEDLGIYHDRIVHMLIVGEDLTTFAHIHPEDIGPVTGAMKQEGRFPLRYTFPKAGRYAIVINYVQGGRELSQQSFLNVAGEPRMETNTETVGKLDRSLRKTFDGYGVTLEAPKRISAGEPAKLTYTITKDGKDITDLEPYLGAAMHLALVRSDLGRVVHTHGQAYLPGSAFWERLFQDYVNYHSHFVPDHFGPKIQTRMTFPQPGLYQIFGEFKHNGKVVMTTFVVRVQ